MIERKDYESRLRGAVDTLRCNNDHTRDELDAIGRRMPIVDMKDSVRFASFCVREGLGLQDSATLLAWVFTQKNFLDDIAVSDGKVYEDAVNGFEQARVNMIIIHRLNYIAHECMLKVYEVLDKRLRFAPKKFHNEAERVWDKYYHDRRRQIEDKAWYTLSDHLRLADAAIDPYREKVYEVIRDRMISLGIKDIEVRGRVLVTLLMCKVMGNSFRHFFEDFRKETGIDYARCFMGDDLSGMTSAFVAMCGALEIGVVKDSDGYWMLNGFDYEKSPRFQSAWKSLISALRDDDLMDRTALNAIEINPGMRDEYQRVLEDKEREIMDESLEQLSDKFKIGKL